MTMDRLSNMLSSIKNASMAKKFEIEVHHSSLCENVAEVLKKRGFLAEVKVFKPKGESFKMLHLELAKTGQIPEITDVKIVSKPGRRIYRPSDACGKIRGGFGIQIVSTSKGVMSGEEARKKSLGGQILCEVY